MVQEKIIYIFMLKVRRKGCDLVSVFDENKQAKLISACERGKQSTQSWPSVIEQVGIQLILCCNY